MSPVAKSGRFEDHSLPRLILDLYAERFTGGLELEHERVQKSITFQKGVPILAASNLSSETLGVQLLDAGKISRESYAKVVGLVQLKKCKEGKALLDLGLLEPKDLFHELKEQVRRRIVECFAWPTGRFALDRSRTPPSDAQPFRTNPVQLVQEGLESHWRPDRILTELEDRLQHYPRPTDRLRAAVRRMNTSEVLETFLAAADGRRTLWAALQQAGSPPPAAIAWVVDALGGFTYAEEPKPDADATLIAENVEIVVVDSEDDAAEREGAQYRGPGADKARPESSAAAKLRQEVMHKFEHLDEANHYEVLGLDPSAKTAAIRKAYVQAAKRYHPDALARMGLDAATRRAANDVFARIAKAQAVLVNSRKRQEYDAALTGGVEEIDAEQVARAEVNFRKGDVLLKQGNFKGAIEFLRGAVEIYGEEPEYQVAYAWALFKKLPSEPEKAREHLDRAIALNAEDAMAHHRLSVVLRALGDDDAAEVAAARATQLDPNVG